MPSAHSKHHAEPLDPNEKKKLILCFDGTGNTFSGSNADTNVVKILRKLDRNQPNQFHYYQTGIGTYDPNETSVNKGVFGEMRSNFSAAIDQGFGTTFDAHVIAGYRFLMRYYETDAKIYMFGFSRGAFTAKFLARMINKVGLLCKGNEEMVPFAYRLYQRYLAGEIKDREARSTDNSASTATSANGAGDPDSSTPLLASEQPPHPPARVDSMLAGNETVTRSTTTTDALNEIEAFSQTFCRKETNLETGEEENIKVFFLGIWDCVASVAVLERKAPLPVAVTGTAHHVRHAVAVDERRVKFKPALLAQDIKNVLKNEDIYQEDIKEVWFPGNHSDVGGGWPATPHVKPQKKSFGQRIVDFWTSRKASKASQNLDDDHLQMSDIPLEWMIREVKKCGAENKDAAVHWCHSLEKFEKDMQGEKRSEAATGFLHDCLSFGYGLAFFKVVMWKFMECLPFLTRWELNDRATKDKLLGWEAKTLPPNFASARDIPRGAVLHRSLLDRLHNFRGEYKPKNNHGDHSDTCLSVDAPLTIYDKEALVSPAARAELIKTARFMIHEEDIFETVVVQRPKEEEPRKIKKRVGRALVWEDDPKHQTYDFNPEYVFKDMTTNS